MSLSRPHGPLAASLMATLLCVPALAEPAPAPAPTSESAESRGVELEVQSSLPGLEASTIESAVRAELAESREPLASRMDLLIRVNKKRLARVEVRAATGEVRTRELALPADPKSALEVLGLVSASLVRSDADALAAALRAAKAPPPEAATSAEANAAAASPSEVPPSEQDAEAPAGSEGASSTANAEDPEKAQGAPASAAPGTKAEDAPAATASAVATKPPPAGQARLESAPANLSFAHPIAILPDSDQKELGFELGLFYSHVGALGGFGANGLVLLSNQHAHGVLVAGLWSDVGGDGSGASFAGLVSRGEGTFEGVTSSGLLDFRKGKVTGGQVAGVWGANEGTLGFQTGGVAAMTHELTGIQVGGVFATSHELRGIQIGGVFARSHVTSGLQTAGVFTVANDLTGIQIAGALASADDMVGVQTAGLVTLAEDTEGLVVAGLVGVANDTNGANIAPVNLARDVDGAQIGIVNVGRKVSGTQIGIVNIADEMDGYPIGVVNAVGNGKNQALGWYGGERMPLDVGFRYLHAPESALSVYTLLAFGVKPDEGDDRYGPGLAVGLRGRPFGPDSRLFLEGDLLFRTETTFRDAEDTVMATGARLALGVEVTPWLALFAGVAPLIVIDDSTVSGPDPLDLPMAGVQVL